MLFARGPNPMIPLRCPFNSRSNSFCQKSNSTCNFFDAVSSVANCFSTSVTFSRSGAVASPTFFSNSAFAFISSGVSTGCPVVGSTTKNSA